MKRLCFIVLVILVLGAPLDLYAADPASRLQEIERVMQQRRAAAEAAAAAAKNAQADMSKLQKQLRSAAAAETKQQTVMNNLTSELDDLHDQAAAARTDLSATGKSQTGALGMMLRLAYTPPAVWWLHDGVSLDQERRMLLLRASVRSLDAKSGQLQQQLEAADRLQTKLTAKQQQLSKAKTALHKEQQGLNGLIAKRQTLASSHLAEREELLRDANRLAATAADLHALLDRMARQKRPSGNKRAPPVAMKTNMTLPVAGRVKQAFGMRDNFGVLSRGATLSARAGSRVVAPWAGKAVFAGPFKGYGDIVILQHPGDYHSLLAGFGRIDVEVGQTVTAGEPVGVLASAQDGGAAELYFELRQDGSPVNPMLVSVAGKR